MNTPNGGSPIQPQLRQGFPSALAATLLTRGDALRAVWSRSWSSDVEFTEYIERDLLPAIASQMELRYKLTKNDTRGFGRVDSIFWDGPEPSCSEPYSITDPRVRAAIEHENAPKRGKGLRSEIEHLLPLDLDHRVLWTYGMSRAAIVSEIRRHAGALGRRALLSRPLTIVLGERSWRGGELIWCRLVTASLQVDNAAEPNWSVVWADGHRNA